MLAAFSALPTLSRAQGRQRTYGIVMAYAGDLSVGMAHAMHFIARVLRTAKAIGVAIPQSVRIRADRVIE